MAGQSKRLEKRIKKLGREARSRAERAKRQARELADDAVVFGLGMPAYALDRVGEAARKAIDAPSRTAQPDRGGGAAGAATEGDTRPYEERTKPELDELARERDVEGRLSMGRAELIEALRRR